MQARIYSAFLGLFVRAMFISLFAIVLIQAMPSVRGEASKARGTAESCRSFVQQFYNWYIREKEPKHQLSKIQWALKNRTSSFTPTLRQRLEEDEAASAKSPGEIVGLDFDPFLNAQDTPDRFIVGNVTQKNGNFWVDVYGVFGGKKSTKPDVTPELTLNHGEWIFTNFYYPPSDSPGKYRSTSSSESPGNGARAAYQVI